MSDASLNEKRDANVQQQNGVTNGSTASVKPSKSGQLKSNLVSMIKLDLNFIKISNCFFVYFI